MWKAPMMEELNVTLTADGSTNEREEGYNVPGTNQMQYGDPTNPNSVPITSGATDLTNTGSSQS